MTHSLEGCCSIQLSYRTEIFFKNDPPEYKPGYSVQMSYLTILKAQIKRKFGRITKVIALTLTGGWDPRN